MSGNVRESQGYLEWSGENSTFYNVCQGKKSFFVVIEVFYLFCLHLKFILI